MACALSPRRRGSPRLTISSRLGVSGGAAVTKTQTRTGHAAGAPLVQAAPQAGDLGRGGEGSVAWGRRPGAKSPACPAWALSGKTERAISAPIHLLIRSA